MAEQLTVGKQYKLSRVQDLRRPARDKSYPHGIVVEVSSEGRIQGCLPSGGEARSLQWSSHDGCWLFHWERESEPHYCSCAKVTVEEV